LEVRLPLGHFPLNLGGSSRRAKTSLDPSSLAGKAGAKRFLFADSAPRALISLLFFAGPPPLDGVTGLPPGSFDFFFVFMLKGFPSPP